MDAPRLEITRQDAEIEIRTYKARVEINSRRPQLRMNRTMARFRVDSRLPFMRLDRSQMYHALGIGPVLESARQYFQEAMQRSIENTGTVSAEGDALMRIENGGNVIADIGAQALDSADSTLSISALPPPAIEWEPGYININWTPATLQMEWDVSAWADIRVEPHYVEIRMKKYPEIHIRVAYDARNHRYKGKIVDEYV